MVIENTIIWGFLLVVLQILSDFFLYIWNHNFNKLFLFMYLRRSYYLAVAINAHKIFPSLVELLSAIF